MHDSSIDAQFVCTLGASKFLSIGDTVMVVTVKGPLILYHIETSYHHNQSLIPVVLDRA